MRYYSKQQQLLDRTKLLSVGSGRTKTSNGSYSAEVGDVYDYLQFAQLVESLVLTEKEAEELLQFIRVLSHDTTTLPSSYKAVRSRTMPALNDR